jgi:PIN domain nuclease of toxin-antitoxin system
VGSLGVIILDTHVWIWWVHDDPQLPLGHKSVLKSQEPAGLGISAISCWEVAKLVEYGRLRLGEGRGARGEGRGSREAAKTRRGQEGRGRGE